MFGNYFPASVGHFCPYFNPPHGLWARPLNSAYLFVPGLLSKFFSTFQPTFRLKHLSFGANLTYMSSLHTLERRYDGLRVYQDTLQTRLCMPIATDELFFEHNPQPSARSSGELVELVETTLGGKFQLPLQADNAPLPARPLATLEIWSLEPGSYDLVLNLPRENTSALSATLIERFVDQARQVARRVDALDLLRFSAGPSLSLGQAQTRLHQLERDSGTRLDAESLAHLLNTHPGAN